MRASPTCMQESPDGTVATHSFPNSFSKWKRTAGLMRKQYLLVVIVNKSFWGSGERGRYEKQLLLHLKIHIDPWVVDSILPGCYLNSSGLCIQLKKEGTLTSKVSRSSSFFLLQHLEMFFQQEIATYLYSCVCMYSHIHMHII